MFDVHERIGELMAGLTRRRSATALAVALLTGCGSVAISDDPSAGASTPATPKPPATRHAPAHPAVPVPAPLRRRAVAIVDAMSNAERAGELMMIGIRSSYISSTAESLLRSHHVGSIVIIHTLTNRASVRSIVDAAQTAASPEGSLLVATDQEGGEIQRLAPPGFTAMPSATKQGALPADKLKARATVWGREMAAAGINLDLAPVLDVVPGKPANNKPIGALERNYGSTPETVARGALAFADGLKAAGVETSGKHFPGLGAVRLNTDYHADVTDRVTGWNSPLLNSYQDAIDHGMNFMMVGTAVYQRIDPGVPAAFSRRIVTDLLRKAMQFRGVVVSDDLGNAVQTKDIDPGDRAVRFVRAGGDIVLSADLSDAGSMVNALESEQSDPAFAKLVRAAAIRIVEAKLRMGLLK